MDELNLKERNLNNDRMFMEEETLSRRDSFVNIQNPESKMSLRQEIFYKKILPGLRGFATFGNDNLEPSHLDSIDIDYMKDSPYEYDINKLFTDFEPNLGFPHPRRKSTFNMAKNYKISYDESLIGRKDSEHYVENMFNSWTQYFTQKKLDEVSEKTFQKKLENFLFIHLKESGNQVHETVESIKKQYFTLQYNLKYMLSNKFETQKFLTCITDFCINSVDGLLNCITKFDDTYTSNYFSKMTQNFDDNLLSSKDLEKNFSEFFVDTEKSNAIISKNQLSTKSKSNDLRSNELQQTHSESVSKSGKRKYWSKNEEKEMLKILNKFYPGAIPTDTINKLSIKYGRTPSSITNKLQKMKKENKTSLEKNQGDMFPRAKDVNFMVINTESMASLDDKLNQERKKFIITSLKNNGNKMIYEDLLKSIPTFFMDSYATESMLQSLKNEEVIDTVSNHSYNLTQLNICIVELIDKKTPTKISNLFVEIFNLFCLKNNQQQEEQYKFPSLPNSVIKIELTQGEILEGLKPNFDIDFKDIEQALNLLIATDVINMETMNYIVLLRDLCGG